MKIIATVERTQDRYGKYFHVKLALGVRRLFYHVGESIVVRNIGPRPWSEATWVDKDGHVNELYAKS